VTEAAEDDLANDVSEADEDQLQRSGLADDVDNVDEEMEEVMGAMTSGLVEEFPVASTSVCVGIDPDLSGAIAVLKSRDNLTTAEVLSVIHPFLSRVWSFRTPLSSF
jgi:hypothetical protein